jgi:hypothetical protein
MAAAAAAMLRLSHRFFLENPESCQSLFSRSMLESNGQ